MSRLTRALIPRSQRQALPELEDALDLGRGETRRKQSAFLILLVLAGIIAICGVLSDSTATVIGAMIIAPLATPILGIALGIVVGRLGIVLRSLAWLVGGLLIVVVLGMLFANLIPDPASLETNSQVVGRTSPQLLDLMAALATGFAGAFAMCRRDLSSVLPGVAISISLVPPLGVVGVCAGEGRWDLALGAMLLFLSNVLALVIAGAVVFTMAGYAREPTALPTARRRRAYLIVGVLTALVVLPLAANTVISVAFARWAVDIRSATEIWLADSPGAEVVDVRWSGTTAIVDVITHDGAIPPVADLTTALEPLPSNISVTVEVTPASEHEVR